MVRIRFPPADSPSLAGIRVASSGFVLAHEASISGDIGGENGHKPAFDPLSARCFLPGKATHFSVCASDRR
jgi:hypothetical protein